MAFPYRDNTNTGGESLCASCKYGEPFRTSKHSFYCALGDLVREVGICNKYVKEQDHGKQ